MRDITELVNSEKEWLRHCSTLPESEWPSFRDYCKENEPVKDRSSDIFTGDMLADHY